MPDGAPVAAAAGAVHLEREPVRAYPPHVTYRNLIDENRRKSGFLVAIVVGIGIAVGGAAGALLGAGGGSADALVPAILTGAVVFGVIASIASVWSWNSGSNAILSMAGARPIEKKDDPQLFNVVEELAIAGGMPLPKVYLIDDPSLNAFATGRDPEHAAVAITTGLRRALTRDELAGVMAHELAHVRHYDIRLMMLMATLVGLIVIAADIVRRTIFLGGMRGGGGRSSGGGKGGNPAMAIAMIVGLVVIILAPIVATIVRFAISRQREYLADAGAVELTRYPQGLIGALEKLGACRVPLQRRNDAIAPLFIVNPAKDAVMNARQNASSPFSTHPPLAERIARLKALL